MTQPITEEARGWNSRLVQWFLHNTQLATLLFLALIIGGTASLLSLKTEGFPSPDINMAIISSSYRGASSTQVEEKITKPLEQAAMSVKGVKDVTSQARDGYGSLQVTFEAGVNFASSYSDLKSKVQSVELPKDADKVDVMTPNVGGNESYYAVTGDESPATLRAQGEVVRQAVEAVPGVKSFKLLSNVQDQVVISWKAADLIKHGVTALQIQQVLGANNLSLPAGSLSLNSNSVAVVTTGTLSNVASVRNTQIKPGLTIGDVAEVAQKVASNDLFQKIGFKESNATNALMSTRSALIYQLTFKNGSDLLGTDKEVNAALDEVRTSQKLGQTSVIAVYDVAADTQTQVDEIVGGAIGSKIGNGPAANLGYLLGGIWLVILAMLVFVSWRAALISALSIPFSLFFTFIALKLTGTTLNTLTLFSMILVLGLVVDPAIVVLEAIQHQLDQGKRGMTAVMTAVNTIGNGVFMAALSSIIVFVPFGVVSGVFGQIIRYIPITVIPALIASYFVPLLFLTYLSRRYLKPTVTIHSDNEEESLWKASRWFIRSNRYILKRVWLQVSIVILAIVFPLGLTGYLFAKKDVVPVQFSSSDDSPSFMVSVEYPSNLTSTEKGAIIAKVPAVLESEKGIEKFFVYNQSAGSVTFFGTMMPKENRSEKSKAIIGRVDTALNSFNQPDKKIFFSASATSVGPSGDSYPVSVNIYGDDLETLKKAAIRTGDLLRENASQYHITRVEDSFTGRSNPQITIALDSAKTQEAGLSSATVSQLAASLISDSTATKYEETIDGAVRTVDVILSNAEKPASLEAISTTVVGINSTGSPVHLRDIATIRQVDGFTGIQRLNGSRYVTVKAEVEDATKDAAAPQQAIKNFWTKDRLTEYGLRSDALQDKGSGNEFIDSFRDLFIALAVAILLTYVVFVIFFRSFFQPFIILFAIPLSFLGVFPALAAIGGEFGFLEILGIITLVGIVENVGIFLIDLANRKQEEGLTAREAISLATGIRLRPIFLTKITALGGLLPLMITSPFWRSLAIVVVTGILTSGVLSLFTTPILYSWSADFGAWRSRRRKHTDI